MQYFNCMNEWNTSTGKHLEGGGGAVGLCNTLCFVMRPNLHETDTPTATMPNYVPPTALHRPLHVTSDIICRSTLVQSQ